MRKYFNNDYAPYTCSSFYESLNYKQHIPSSILASEKYGAYNGKIHVVCFVNLGNKKARINYCQGGDRFVYRRSGSFSNWLSTAVSHAFHVHSLVSAFGMAVAAKSYREDFLSF